MSNDTLPTIDRTAYIRTYVPYLVGGLLGFLVTRFEAVRAAINWLDTQLPAIFPGTNWRDLLDWAVIAAVTALYYWGARQLGRRWPKLEKWLLGSSAVPNYTAR
jgi:hypothetical protein